MEMTSRIKFVCSASGLVRQRINDHAFSLHFQGPSYLTVTWFGHWGFAFRSTENLDHRGDDFKNKVSGSHVNPKDLACKGDNFKNMFPHAAHTWKGIQ